MKNKQINIGKYLFYKGIIHKPKGISVFDSKSPEYYLLILQESRTQFCNLQSELCMKRNLMKPFRLVRILAQLFLRFWHLKITNQIVQAYISEYTLLEMSNESR